MTVLIFTNNGNGLYLFRNELIKKLSEDNKVICCVPEEDNCIDKLESLGCRCEKTDFERRSTNPVNDLRLLNRYRKLIRKHNPDSVLTYTIKPNVYGGMACRMEKIPYIANITGLGSSIENGGLLSRISLVLYRIGLKEAECIFFQNENNMHVFEKNHIFGKNSKLIPGSGVNVETHYLEPYPADDDCFKFLFVGRIKKDKGINELLEAIAILKKQGRNLLLDVVGGFDENYQDVLSDYEKKGYLKYHGKQSDVHLFYKNAHCLVHPSFHEGMANVLLEASSVGRPVIASRVPGCRETFEEGVTGFGCEAGDSQSLVSAMTRMMDMPWNDRKKMGLSAHDKVVREFDRKIVVNAYMDQLKRIAEKTAK